MHCPSCGANASSDQKFCRACGLSLEKVPDLLAGQAQAMSQLEKGHEYELGRKFENWGRLVVVLGLTGFLPVGLATGIYVLLRSGNTLGALALCVVGVVLILGALPLAWGEYLRKSSRGRRPTEPGILKPAASTTKALEEPRFELQPSVTENTTELLEPPNTNKK